VTDTLWIEKADFVYTIFYFSNVQGCYVRAL